MSETEKNLNRERVRVMWMRGGANIRCEPPFAAGRGTVWRECSERGGAEKK